jgi:hypothetical protein
LAAALLPNFLRNLSTRAAHVVDGLLGARVEGVRLAGGVQLEQRQLAAVVHLHGLAAMATQERVNEL